MPNAQQCINAIKKVLPQITDDQLETFVEQIDAGLSRYENAADFRSVDEVMAETIQNAARDLNQDSVMRARAKIGNTRKMKALQRSIDEEVAKGNDWSLGVEAALVGSAKAGKRRSVHHNAQAMSEGLLARLVTKLDEANILDHYARMQKDKKFERAVWQEVYNITGDNAKPTNNEVAMKMARIIHETQEVMREHLNSAGGEVQLYRGRVMRTEHNPNTLLKVGEDEWTKDIIDLIDWQKTFPLARSRGHAMELLRKEYHQLKNGQHLDVEGTGEISGEVTRNVGKKVSAKRVFHFKDADAAYDYHQKYKMNDFGRAVISEFDHNSRAAALMQVFGTNPQDSFNTIVAHGRAKHGPEKGTRAHRIETQFKNVAQIDAIPGSMSVAKYASMARAIQSISKLGMATLSSFTDLANLYINFRMNDMSVLTSASKALGRVPGLTKDRKEFGHLLGIGMDGFRGTMFGRFGESGSTTGHGLTRAQNLYFRLNGLGYWTDSLKAGTVGVLGRHLAMQSRKNWDQLSPQIKKILEQYDMTAARWDLLRENVPTVNGHKMMLPGMFDSEEGFEKLARFLGTDHRATVNQFRMELDQTLRTYFHDQANIAVPTPGARTKAFMHQGQAPGTIVGEVLRFMGQFKQFPVTIAQEVLPNVYYNSIGRGSKIMHAAEMVIASTLMGYVALSAKDLAKGNTTRDPMDHMTITDAFIQGGAGAIYADFILSQHAKYGGNIFDAFAGPVLGSTADMAELLQDPMNKNGEFRWYKGKKIVEGVLPMNIFYTKALLDYYIVRGINERLNPGWKNREKRRLEETGQERYLGDF